MADRENDSDAFAPKSSIKSHSLSVSRAILSAVDNRDRVAAIPTVSKQLSGLSRG
jgi:hypothetical protein